MKCLHCHLVSGRRIHSIKLQNRIGKFTGSGSGGTVARLVSARRKNCGSIFLLLQNAETGNGLHSIAYSMPTRDSLPGVKGG